MRLKKLDADLLPNSLRKRVSVTATIDESRKRKRNDLSSFSKSHLFSLVGGRGDKNFGEQVTLSELPTQNGDSVL